MSTAHAMIYISPFCSQHSIVLEMNVATKVHALDWLYSLHYFSIIKNCHRLNCHCVTIALKNTFLLPRANGCDLSASGAYTLNF